MLMLKQFGKHPLQLFSNLLEISLKCLKELRNQKKKEKVGLIKMNDLHGMLMSVGFCVGYRVGGGHGEKKIS